MNSVVNKKKIVTKEIPQETIFKSVGTYQCTEIFFAVMALEQKDLDATIVPNSCVCCVLKQAYCLKQSSAAR